MVIDVSKLIENDGSSVEIDQMISVDHSYFDNQDVFFNAPAKVQGSIKSISKLLCMELNVNAQYIAKCSRCLKDTEEELDFEINEVFAKPGLESENDDVIILDSNEIDLTDIIMQALSCALPISSLCSDDCKGLCPVCGCDLNFESCDCETDSIDPRMAALKDFLK